MRWLLVALLFPGDWSEAAPTRGLAPWPASYNKVSWLYWTQWCATSTCACGDASMRVAVVLPLAMAGAITLLLRYASGLDSMHACNACVRSDVQSRVVHGLMALPGASCGVQLWLRLHPWLGRMCGRSMQATRNCSHMVYLCCCASHGDRKNASIVGADSMGRPRPLQATHSGRDQCMRILCSQGHYTESYTISRTCAPRRASTHARVTLLQDGCDGHTTKLQQSGVSHLRVVAAGAVLPTPCTRSEGWVTLT